LILATTIYEKNFKQVLTNDNWFFKIEIPSITKKICIVNNLNSYDEFKLLEQKFEHKAEFVYCDDIWLEAVSAFDCDLHPGEISYLYSIQYFCALYVALKKNVKYVLNVGADCRISDLEIEDYIVESASLIDSDPSVLLTTIPWSEGDFETTGNHEQDTYGITKRHDRFWFSKVVSDQVFFSSPQKLQGANFNIKENLHSFPGYGGDSFEKRLCNYLVKADCYRAIYKKYNYYHKSF
jgi:hypothetical protein